MGKGSGLRPGRSVESNRIRYGIPVPDPLDPTSPRRTHSPRPNRDSTNPCPLRNPRTVSRPGHKRSQASTGPRPSSSYRRGPSSTRPERTVRQETGDPSPHPLRHGTSPSPLPRNTRGKTFCVSSKILIISPKYCQIRPYHPYDEGPRPLLGPVSHTRLTDPDDL